MHRAPDMFGKPRRPSRVLMHWIDRGYEGAWAIGHFTCKRCGHDAGWIICDTEAEMRGIPCPNCNTSTVSEA